jgi:hypothetical protein
MSRRNTAANSLAAAQEALQETAEQLKALTARRREVLLAGTDDEVGAVDAEIEAAQRTQRTRTDRVSVLIEAAEQEAVARRAKEHAALIGRVEAKLAERDRIAAELASHVAAADAALLKLFAVNRQILAAWPWGNGDLGAVLLGDGVTLNALRNEIYRVSGRPPSTGGMPSDPRGPSYPGGKCEDLLWIMMPEKTRPMVAKFAEASAAASVIMRTGRNGPAPAMNGAAHPPANASPAEDASANIGDVPQGDRAPAFPAPPPMPAPAIERTPAQVELAKLLSRQHTLAMSDDPKDEIEYLENGKKIAALS